MYRPSSSLLLVSSFVVVASAACGDVTPAVDAGDGIDARSYDSGTAADATPSFDASFDAAGFDAAWPDAGIVACAHDECSHGIALDATCSTCAAQICQADPFCCETAWDLVCQREAESICGFDCPAFCGDQTCDPNEDSMTCVDDCPMCGDQLCHPDEVNTCPDDCNQPVCGDNTCDSNENCSSCPDDCGDCVCGDTMCDVGECSTCEDDCPNGCVCHDICEEGPLLDPTCSPCAAQICQVDPYCCETAWDAACVSEVETVCNEQCPAVPPQ